MHTVLTPASFAANRFLSEPGIDRVNMTFGRRAVVFAQGEPAASVYYLQSGTCVLTRSERGVSAVLGYVKRGEFFGEGCLAGLGAHNSTAIARTDIAVMQISIAATMAALRTEPEFASLFIAFLFKTTCRAQTVWLKRRICLSER